MRKITTYVADDGTEFKSEEECREYEYEHSCPKTYMLDMQGNETNDWDITYYCYIPKDVNAEELCEKVYDYEGYDIPNDNGFFYWCEETHFHSYWRPIDERLKELQSEIDTLCKFKNSLMGMAD